MSVLDARLRRIALQLIEKFGKRITLRTPATSEYDAPTGRAAATPSDQVVKALIHRHRRRNAPGTTNRAAAVDVNVIVAAKGLAAEPSQETIVVIGNTGYTVADVEPVYSGEEVAIYQLRLAR